MDTAITKGNAILCARDLARKLGFRDMYINEGRMLNDWSKTDLPRTGYAHVFAKGPLPEYNGIACTIQIPNIYVSDGSDGKTHIVCTLESDGKERKKGFVIRIRDGNIYEASLIDGRSSVGEKEMTEMLKSLLQE